MIEGFFSCSIMSRAQKKGIAEIHIHNLRDYAYDRYRKVDDYPFGGCAGMVMKIEPIDRCISALKAERHYDEIIFTTPDGEQFDQKMGQHAFVKSKPDDSLRTFRRGNQFLSVSGSISLPRKSVSATMC